MLPAYPPPDPCAISQLAVLCWTFTLRAAPRSPPHITQPSPFLHAPHLQGSWTGRASQARRLAVTMLTGDNEASAQRIARKLGIRSVWAALRCAGGVLGAWWAHSLGLPRTSCDLGMHPVWLVSVWRAQP